MTPSFAYAVVCALAVLTYVISGFVAQAFVDPSLRSTTGFALGAAVGAAVLVGLVAYFLFSFIQRRLTRKDRPADPYRPGRGLAIVTLLVVSLAAGSGGLTGRAKQAERLEAAAAAETAAAAERARIAALTPEQLAAIAKQREEQAAAAAKAAAEKERLAALERERTARRDAQLQLAGAGAMTLKSSMKDPQSFNLTSLVVKDNGVACYQYRAINSFGAILPSSAVMTAKGKMLSQAHDGNAFVSVWNKECAPAGGDEIAELLKRKGII